MSFQSQLYTLGFVEAGFSHEEVDAATDNGMVSVMPQGGPFAFAPNYNVNPNRYARFHEEFWTLSTTVDHVSGYDTIDWVGTDIANPAAIVDTVATRGQGVLQLATGITSGDGFNLQWHTGAIQIESQKCFFSARIMVASTSGLDARLGLYDVSTNVFGGTPKEIGFRLTNSVLSAACRDAMGVTTAACGVTLDGSDWYELAWRRDLTGEVHFFIDGNEVAEISTNVPFDVGLAPTWAIKSASAGTKSAYIDFIDVLIGR